MDPLSRTHAMIDVPSKQKPDIEVLPVDLAKELNILSSVPTYQPDNESDYGSSSNASASNTSGGSTPGVDSPTTYNAAVTVKAPTHEQEERPPLRPRSSSLPSQVPSLERQSIHPDQPAITRRQSCSTSSADCVPTLTIIEPAVRSALEPEDLMGNECRRASRVSIGNDHRQVSRASISIHFRRASRASRGSKDLVAPVIPSIPVPPNAEKGRSGSNPEDLDEALASKEASAATPDAVAAPIPPVPSSSSEEPQPPWLKRQINRVLNVFTFESKEAPEPELVFPTAPDDKEKLAYLTTNRVLLYTFGVFGFMSLCTGMWLFVISSWIFAWFGLFVAALQVYMMISYFVGLVGKDWDYKGHVKILEETPLTEENTPTVDIYLPVAKEPIEILRNTWEHIAKLTWPADKLKVYVLDDGALESVKAMAAEFGFNYIVRDDRPRLKKAGNLRWAFTRTYGDFFNIYDADFCPRSDFLLETIPRMVHDPQIAVLQTPQYFRTTDKQTWVEQGAGGVQELFYRVVQVNRDRWGASICVGSNAVYRRSALVEVGGTAEIGFSEDVHTGFYAVNRGWKLRYIPLCLACGVCPDSPRAFFSQQMRWCMGSTTLLSNPDFWKSKLSLIQKCCYLCGFMYYSACALNIFVSPLPGTLLIWTRPEFFKYYNLFFALPSLVSTMVMMRCWAKATYGLNVQHIMIIQNYAYLTTIKDKILGRGLAWAPSGDAKAHKNNKYRNMRILAWCWLLAWFGSLIAGMGYQISRGLGWYECIPLLLLDALNFYLAHRFLLYG